MEIKVARNDQTTQYTVQGSIDETGAEEIKRCYRENNDPAVKEVVFDIGGVNHIGSAGIGKLMLIYKEMALRGGHLKVVQASEPVYDLLATVKLDTIFSISRN
jgi:anti-sigma B factor antagonist